MVSCTKMISSSSSVGKAKEGMYILVWIPSSIAACPKAYSRVHSVKVLSVWRWKGCFLL
jgi:hypothetical protein